MAGYVLQILPPTSFDFTNLVATANAQFVVPIAQRIDVSQFEFWTVEVRVHSVTITNSGGIDVLVGGDGFTPDDPTLTGLHWAVTTCPSAVAGERRASPARASLQQSITFRPT
jgi:hypothetical protein